MKWTQLHPMQEGYYWFIGTVTYFGDEPMVYAEPTIKQIFKFDDDWTVGGMGMQAWQGWWCGPLVAPALDEAA